MAFKSILYLLDDGMDLQENSSEPDFFRDLNLDKIVESIVAGKEEYRLNTFFYSPPGRLEEVSYRHEIFRELENRSLADSLGSFAKSMQKVRKGLAQIQKLYHPLQQQRWHLDSAEMYCRAVLSLRDDVSALDLKSRGFALFREYLTEYAQSDRFKLLCDETNSLLKLLQQVNYRVHIKGNTVHVDKYEEDDIDYSADVEDTFSRFRQGAVKDYRIDFHESLNMNTVEGNILSLVAQLYPEVFQKLESFCGAHQDFVDNKLAIFDREVQFYLAYMEFTRIFTAQGLKFCYPKVIVDSKEIYDTEGFDMALAHKLLTENCQVVCNDFYLRGMERILVVSGPNQGGKTTFARTFGQLHYFASLGCPVPGMKAQLFLPDGIFTHFEREEDFEDLRGKLHDDLVRIHQILAQATSSSILILNEVFSSTTLQDALFLSKKVLERVMELDMLCVCVTFIDELASLNEKTVSMMSTVIPENPAERTFKVVRKPADGRSYALAIAQKHHVTYQAIKERMRDESTLDV